MQGQCLCLSALLMVQLQNFQSLQKFRLDSIRCGNVIRSKPANPLPSPPLLLSSPSFLNIFLPDYISPHKFLHLLSFPVTNTKLLFFYISPKSIFVVCICVCVCVCVCVMGLCSLEALPTFFAL